MSLAVYSRNFCLFLLSFIFSNAFIAQQNYTEVYTLNWIKTKEWKVEQKSDMVPFMVTVYTHPGETIETWEEIGYTTHYRDVPNMPLDSFMYKLHDQSKMAYPNSKLTFLEKKEKPVGSWILFTIEVPETIGLAPANAQIYHITVGKQGIYCSYITSRRNMLKKEEVKKWSKFFKTSTLKTS